MGRRRWPDRVAQPKAEVTVRKGPKKHYVFDDLVPSMRESARRLARGHLDRVKVFSPTHYEVDQGPQS